ncbi:unnamed protein product [Miscanthus lutarioriparius]|uniref:Uncharacterized protein n=1 Tax=Miscanthus lutarioriparius TaxID=422564 RepID=A0A811PZJ8_9POAL|nr:unnamed protein product [Miscanthus lutarioriparius]
MAAEIVTSAVAQEAVNQVLSRFKDRCEQNSEAKDRIERMEMAHIKLEAALETSNKWNITTRAPLLRWQSKLKRAVQECDHTLRRCRQRLQEEEEMQNSVRSSSFPKQIAYAARSFVSSIFSRGSEDELRSSAAVRRFERYADGASEFLRYVELGGTPRRYMFFDPLIRHLLAGKGTKYCFVRGSQHLSFLLQPFRTHDHGVYGNLVLLLKDSNASENNFLLALNLRLSESIDIVGVAVSCLQLFIPHLSSTVEAVKTKLTQLPTQDLCWVSSVCERQNNLYSICSKWLQPNPLCCQQQDHYYAQSYNATSSSSESLLCDIYLEPVMHVYLSAHVSLSVEKNKQRAVIDEESETSRTRDFPYLKFGMHFFPHTSFQDLSPRVEGSATEMINGEAVQHGSFCANISCFEQLCKMMLPKAVDCLHGNVAATSYQMLWKSKHGGAILRVQKIPWRLTTQKDMGGKRSERQQVKKVQGWASANNEFNNSWIAHVPAKFLGSAMDWIQAEKRLPQPLLFITNSCVHDCPIKLLCLQFYRSFASKIKSFSMFNA